jgi:hypothetical protein
MAALKPLKPPVVVGITGLDGYDLLCTEAGRSDDGLTGMVVAQNGDLSSDPLKVRFGIETHCTAVRQKLATHLGVEPKVLEVPLRTLYALTENALREAAKPTQAPDDERYSEQDGCICRRGPDGSWIPVCNFTATITEQVIRDDGAEERSCVRIAGRRATGQPYPTVLLPQERFSAMNWPIERWGPTAIVYAGQGNRDHLRVGIQVLSPEPSARSVFTHSGWRTIDGVPYYLHGGGAIGPDGSAQGIDVELEGKLHLAVLPDPPQDEALHRAVRASLELAEIAPESVSMPLQAVTYRAPLGAFLPLDTSVFLSGLTGALKTSLSALSQAHWGSGFHDRELPGSWLSTANSLEKLAFLAKDMVLVIDDLVFSGSQREVDATHALANRVLRAVGNQAARGRMRSDTSLRPDYTPRCAVLTSGEDLPRGHSLGARILVVPVSPGDVNIERLGAAQRLAREGVLAQAMSGYVQWIAQHDAALQQMVPERFDRLRTEAQREGVHLRLPATEAHLLVGWEVFLTFALECGAIRGAELQAYAERAEAALRVAATRTQAHLATQDLAQRFVSLLSAALSTGVMHLTNRDDGAPLDAARWGWRARQVGEDLQVWETKGTHVGWLDEGVVYLEPTACYSAVQSYAQRSGSALGAQEPALWKALRARGLLVAHDPDRNTTRKTLGHKEQRPVIALAATAL